MKIKIASGELKLLFHLFNVSRNGMFDFHPAKSPCYYCKHDVEETFNCCLRSLFKGQFSY